MEINEYEAGMLDAVLEAFAGRAEMDWTQLLELFDGDEELAAAITDILAGAGLVDKIGEESKSGLPEKIIPTGETLAVISKGGFTAQVKQGPPPTAEQIKPVPEEQPAPNREIVFEVENKLPEMLAVQEEATAKPEPPAVIPEAEKPEPDVLLHQEIAQLRFDQRNFEHKLREKDITIRNLTSQNETLGQFRIFIWVLLGIIALLAAGLLFRFHK